MDKYRKSIQAGPHWPRSRCRSRLAAFGGPSFRWWTSLRLPDPLRQLLTDIHKQMGWSGGAERGWGGYRKASGWFFFFFCFLSLAGFDSLTSLPRRAGTDPDSRDDITSWWNDREWRGIQSQWRDINQCQQKQANAIIFDIGYDTDRTSEGRIKELTWFYSILHVTKSPFYRYCWYNDMNKPK